MPVDDLGNEVAEVIENVETPEEVIEEAPALLTQEQFDAALQERLGQAREQSAAELQALRRDAEAEINGYRRALDEVRSGNAAAQGVIQDDPEPQGMDANQRTLWHADKFNRIQRKKEAAELRAELFGLVKPLQTDSTSTEFFAGVSARAGGKTIPETLKAKTLELYRNAINDPNMAGAKPQQVIEAAWTRALAIQMEQQIMGSAIAGVPQKSAAGRPATGNPRIATPPSADISGATRAAGMGRIGKKDQTWQEIQAELINKNKFPEDQM